MDYNIELEELSISDENGISQDELSQDKIFHKLAEAQRQLLISMSEVDTVIVNHYDYCKYKLGKLGFNDEEIIKIITFMDDLDKMEEYQEE